MRIHPSFKVALFFILIFFSQPASLFGQLRNDLFYSGLLEFNLPISNDNQNAVFFNYQAEYSSNALSTNSLLQPLLSSSLNAQNVNEIENNLAEINTLDYRTNINLSYYRFSNSFLGKSWGYFVELGQSNLVDATFTKNLFKILRYGNSPYRAEKFETGNNQLNHFKARHLKIGTIKTLPVLEKQSMIKVGLSFLGGHNLLQANSSKFNIFTDEYGEYIDVDYNFNLSQSSASFISGFGLALDFALGMQLNDNASISIGVKNLGRVNWFQNQTTYLTGNNTDRIEGLHLSYDDLEDFNDKSINNFVDSLTEKYSPDSSKQSTFSNLPAVYQLHYSTITSEHYCVFIDFILQPKMGDYPRIMGGLAWNKKGLQAAISAGLNMNGQFTSGIKLGYRKEKLFVMMLGNGIEGLMGSSNNSMLAVKAGFLF